ncbi:MAG: hypothetical protein QXL57_08865 [Candidatus Bathyarchaeia archaeon]
MKERPNYEKYPVSEEEMGKRYKNWTEALARQMVVLYRVGKEVGGEKFVERLKEEYYMDGQKSVKMWISLTGTTPEDFKDCKGLSKVMDFINDYFANFWDGYVENTPKAFEVELKTCPVAKQWSREPELCEILVSESLKGLLAGLNPKFKTKGFTKLLTKGDNCCRYRIELTE